MFSYQFLQLTRIARQGLADVSHLDVLETNTENHFLHNPYQYDGKSLVYIIPLLVFITSGLLFMMSIAQKRIIIRETLEQSLMARYTVRSTIVVSWLLSIHLFTQYVHTMYCMNQFIDTDPTMNVYKEFFKVQTTFGCTVCLLHHCVHH